MKIAWFEAVDTMNGEAYTTTDHGVAIHETKEEIEEEIQYIREQFKQEIAAGEREEGDEDLGFYPKKVLLTTDGRIFDSNIEDITERVLMTLRRDANITDPRQFINEIKRYAQDIQLPPYQKAFGTNYQLGINIPSHWTDISYKNDQCPSFLIELPNHQFVRLWVTDTDSSIQSRYSLVKVSKTGDEISSIRVVAKTNDSETAQLVIDNIKILQLLLTMWG